MIFQSTKKPQRLMKSGLSSLNKMLHFRENCFFSHNRNSEVKPLLTLTATGFFR